MNIENLEEKMYRTDAVGYYAFVKWYDRYIDDLLYLNINNTTGTVVYTKYNEEIAYRIEKEKRENEVQDYDFYVSKPYFDMLRDFDFENTSPRKITKIIETEVNGVKQYTAETTTLKYIGGIENE